MAAGGRRGNSLPLDSRWCGLQYERTPEEVERAQAMNLTIASREAQGVTILDLSGRLVMGQECNSLREQVTQLLAAKKSAILLNLGGLTYVDSSGIGILVESVINTAKEGGRLKLVNLPRLLHNTLMVHRLLAAFEVFDQEEEALASFA